MSISLKKLWNDHSDIGNIIIAVIVLYGLYMLFTNLRKKGFAGSEMMSQDRKGAYSSGNGGSGPQPAQEGGNEIYTSVSESNQAPMQASSQNPADLLPKDNNSQWAQLNPAGKGDLSNINLLKAGYHIGIDTIGQTLRNPNLQLRSEPPNPQVNTGPWNQTTIESDYMRPSFEIGQGGQ
jgi:hypothetical protein